MFSSNPIEINKSSLVSLKAEILRKQQELKTNKTFSKPVPKPIVPKQKKKQGNETGCVTIEDDEDRELLAKSKQILESKTKLYNMLSKHPSSLSDKERELSKRTLVQFDRKESVPLVSNVSDEENHSGEEYDAKELDEEWVEYVDALGRTRKCLRKDLDYMKRKDRDLSERIEGSGRLREEPQKFIKETVDEDENKDEKIIDLSEDNELLSSDMRREILRREWEKQEEDLLNKKNIHYQDLLFHEARSHGVGYYAFSQDEVERAKQQENLKKLRTETTEKQKATSELKALREKQLAARLKAARNRKRARMGLPPEEDEPKKSEESKTENEEEKRKRLEKETEEKRKQEERDRFVRPWDIGKEILKKHYEYSQDEWVSKKRQERPMDFAPPSSYNRDRKFDDDNETSNKSLYFSTNKNKRKSTKNINPYLQKSREEFNKNEKKSERKSDEEKRSNDSIRDDSKRDEEEKSNDFRQDEEKDEQDSEESSKQDNKFDSEKETPKIDFIFQHTKSDPPEIDFKFVTQNNPKITDQIQFNFQPTETSKSPDSESINFNFTKLDEINSNPSESASTSTYRPPDLNPEINFTFKRPILNENTLAKKLKTSKYISPFSFPAPSVYPSYDMGMTLPVRQEDSDRNVEYSPSDFIESSDNTDDDRRNEKLDETVPKIDPMALEESVMAGLRYLREQAEMKSKKNRDEDFIS